MLLELQTRPSAQAAPVAQQAWSRAPQGVDSVVEGGV
jgi:hypothetical protein